MLLPGLFPDFSLSCYMTKKVTLAIEIHVLDSQRHRFCGEYCINSYGSPGPVTE